MSSAVDAETDVPQSVATAPPPPRVPGKPRRAGRVIAGCASALVLALLAYVGAAGLHPLPAAAVAVSPDAVQTIETAPVAPAWPTQGSAAVGLVGQPGLLGSSGSDASVPIASMTKTITALVLIDKYDVPAGGQGPTVTFGPADVDILRQVWAQDGSWAKVQAGEKLTLVQALTTMMLKSANNYARSLAVWSYGSQAAFVKAANTWLTQHGFTHSHMTDPSGFDPGSVSNMTDLVGIGELAIADPVLGKIVDLTTTTLPVVGKIKNTDPLVGKYGIEGVKTGYTKQAGHCLLFAAKVAVNGTSRTLVGVMLGQPTYSALWAKVPKLLASYEQGFHEVDLTDAGKTVYATYTTPWGSSTKLVAATQPSVEIYSASAVTVSVNTDSLATVADNAVAGTVTFRYGQKQVVAELRASGAMTGPDLWWRLTHPDELF